MTCRRSGRLQTTLAPLFAAVAGTEPRPGSSICGACASAPCGRWPWSPPGNYSSRRRFAWSADCWR